MTATNNTEAPKPTPTEAPKPVNHILVVTLGYYGLGRTVREAAENCKKAGSPLSYKAVVTIANCPIKFRPPFYIEYHNDGSFMGKSDEFTVRTLGALITGEKI